MKNLSIILLLIIFSGCEKESTIEQIIENNTEHTVVIETYKKGVNLESIAINPNSSYSKTSVTIGPGPGYVILLNSSTDSVNIVFNEEKIIVQASAYPLTYCAADLYRDILCLKEYERVDKSEYSICYTYHITEEDYENADLIE